MISAVTGTLVRPRSGAYRLCLIGRQFGDQGQRAFGGRVLVCLQESTLSLAGRTARLAESIQGPALAAPYSRQPIAGGGKQPGPETVGIPFEVGNAFRIRNQVSAADPPPRAPP